ncbi:hypothetical protein GYMLUDRAFT_70455 [Collybiopsis luxurians FD-317 M1]|nr:hypothetical protein GYMLUDRAFT_70455 [Collybiopsis luxurians FD-317 M1]
MVYLSSTHVKPEPLEAKVPAAPLSMSSSANAGSSNSQVKTEQSLDDLLDMAYPAVSSRDTSLNFPQNAFQISGLVKNYTSYQSVADIPYSAEMALKEGLAMVQHIKAFLSKLSLGSKLRQDVWKKNIADLEAHTTPKTLIAVCGATGAGKSSILNALLDVVTEIAHHSKSTIDADVSFLSVSEWKQELVVLQHDLTEEDGSLKRTSDLKSDAGVAWQKVHAVYPTLSQEKLVRMTVDQIIVHDPRVANVLGTTKHISARNSRVFGEEIAKYIDSKNQSRGKRDKEKKKGRKDDEKSLMDKVREAAGASKKKEKKDSNAPAFWPLIRQVNVRCAADCLSSGCILVDLPGVADANAARNSIAKDYMKRAQCIWVLAPITRAVDDKTARDLLGDAFRMQLMSDYDDHAITFIASKTDDISCTEVISALHLEDDSELEAIQEELDKLNDERADWTRKRKQSDKLVKAVEKELKTLRAIRKEYRDHIEALRNGEHFTPVLTALAGSQSTGKKRKNNRKGKKASPKRRRSSLDSDQDSDVDMEEDETGDESTSSSSENDSDVDSDKDSISGIPDSEGSETVNTDNSDIEVEALVEEITEETVRAKLEKISGDIKGARTRLSDARKEKKSAIDCIANLKKSLAKVQRTKNGWCSIKRSEFSRDVLKEDFRTGLKELDDELAEKKDPDNFDPNVNLRNYDAINLPVFTCSSRDYVRLTNQVKGDGEPTCFSDKTSTGIPDLQAWCHTLTIASRTRAVKNFYNLLKTFATSISLFVSGIGGVTLEDRRTLQDKWESQFDDGEGGGHYNLPEAYHDPFDAYMQGHLGYHELLSMGNMMKAPKVDDAGELVGITPRLNKEFAKLIGECEDQLKMKFKDGLEDKCRVGASLSASGAVELSDYFAASMHWGTYRATLRRHGDWRRNLNIELLAPFTRNIAASWSKLFETDLLRPFEDAVETCVRRLIEDMASSAAPGLRERVKMQGDVCLEEVHVALKQAVAVVRDTVNTEQKEVSRSLAPHVQNNLIDGYNLAMDERGKGSVARQKLVFRTFLSERKDNVFDEGADVLMGRLDSLCSSVGQALLVAFKELAKKIEVNLAVLWEKGYDDPQEATGRKEMLEAVTEILLQVQLWLTAATDKAKSASAVALALQKVDMGMD